MMEWLIVLLFSLSLSTSSSSSLFFFFSLLLYIIKIHADSPFSDHAVTREKPQKRVIPPAIHHGRECCELRATFYHLESVRTERTRDCAPLVIVLLRLYVVVVAAAISSC